MNTTKNKRNIIIIWIDQNIYNQENMIHYQDLYKTLQLYTNNYNYNLYLCTNVESSINFIKTVKFIETFIIVSGSLYLSFIDQFKQNLIKICIVPKIVIFTSDNNRLNLNMNYYEFVEDKFYCYGGVITNFEEIKNFIISEQNYYDYQIDLINLYLRKKKKIINIFTNILMMKKN